MHPQQSSPQLSLCTPPILVRRGRFSPSEASRPTILIPPETSSGLVAALFPQSDDELVVETFFLRAGAENIPKLISLSGAAADSLGALGAHQTY